MELRTENTQWAHHQPLLATRTPFIFYIHLFTHAPPGCSLLGMHLSTLGTHCKLVTLGAPSSFHRSMVFCSMEGRTITHTFTHSVWG